MFDFSTQAHKNDEKPTGQVLCGGWSFARPESQLMNCTKMSETGEVPEFDFMGSDLFVSKFSTSLDEPKNEIVEEYSSERLWKFAKCLDVEKRFNTAGNYVEWRNLNWSLASVGAYELAKELSKTGLGNETLEMWDEMKFDDIYNSFDNKRKITLGTFMKYCKIDNPELYRELKDEFSKRQKKFEYIQSQYDKNQK